jgi:hypothetical protein
MDTTNLTLDLNKILRPFITRITALESTVLRLQAALDKTNTISKQARPVVQEVPSKPTPTVRNSYAAIVRSTVHNTTMDVRTTTDEKAKVTNLPYAPACSTERQSRMARGECFGCGQKGHTQKNCPTHSFEKIRPLLNPELNRSMNPVPRTDVKTNMKSLTSPIAKTVKPVSNLIAKRVTISRVPTTIAETALTMKPVMKTTAKPVANMNMRTNLSENTRTASTKEIRIVLPATPRTTSPRESENESS